MKIESLCGIEFPVYKLPKGETHNLSGVLYLDYEGRRKIIDNLNLPGHNLASRRLSIPKRDRLKLKKALLTPEELLRSKGKNLFIDSSGYLFNYERKKFFPLKSYRIKKIRQVKLSGYSIEVHGIVQRFFVKNKPSPLHTYVSIIDIGGGYILYGFSDHKLPDTRRKV